MCMLPIVKDLRLVKLEDATTGSKEYMHLEQQLLLYEHQLMHPDVVGEPPAC